MELIHKLIYNGTTSTIDEPIGFDNLKMSMQRHEYHGMGVEVSLDSLTFYGNAYEIITSAYSTDIDSDITYEVTMEDGSLLYQGKIDLSTLQSKNGEYQCAVAKVGEVGIKTIFNNRIETDVDLNTPKTVDGSNVDSPTWKKLHIPQKHLLYTNIVKQKTTKTIPFYLISDIYQTLGIKLDDASVHEFGDVNIEDENGAFIFVKTDGFEEQYGEDTTFSIEANLLLEIKYSYIKTTFLPHDQYLKLQLVCNNTVLAEGSFDEWELVGSNVSPRRQPVVGQSVRLEYSGTVNTGTLQLRLVFQTDENPVIDTTTDPPKEPIIEFQLKKSSYIKMRMYDTLVETDKIYADMLLVHDALNIVSHAISENALAVKSEWYQSPECHWNAGSIGGGACKAITNGYHIRGLFTEGEYERNMPLSFKSLIENLSALDCVGWGFSTESNTLYIRVERWSWFYKDTILIDITDVAEVTTDIYQDRIPTELKIGYKKYATSDQYNSIDSPHGTRTFVNGIKAVSKTITKQCDFIADNYAIEETRRANFQKNETEETAYDENAFIFELVREAPSSNVNDGTYVVGHTAYNAVNVGRVEEFINAKLTPRHMAARWRSILYAANNPTPFKFKTGEINYKASFNCIPTEATVNNKRTNSLQSMATDSRQAENSDISYTPAKFKAEKITFSYPLTLAQYNAVKANPYGLIGVNGRYGWIMDFKYTFVTGMADFTLIAKR